MSYPAAPAVRVSVNRSTLLAHAKALPAAPHLLAGIVELLEDINSGLDRVAAEIRLEPALAARVIRISNSVIFGGGPRVGSVEEAVNRVGFSEVMRVVGTATVAGLVDRSLSCYGVRAEALRDSVLLHAFASEALATVMAVDSRHAYTAGLLRAIGMMVLDREGRKTMDTAEAYDPAQFDRYATWELLHFGVVSSDVTSIILDDWRFPGAVVVAVQSHLLQPGGTTADSLASVLNLAGAIVAGRGLALPGDMLSWRVTPQKLQAAGLSEELFEQTSVQACLQFERYRNGL